MSAARRRIEHDVVSISERSPGISDKDVIRIARACRPCPPVVTPDLIRGPEPQAPSSPGFPRIVVRGEPGPRIKSGVTAGGGDGLAHGRRRVRRPFPLPGTPPGHGEDTIVHATAIVTDTDGICRRKCRPACRVGKCRHSRPAFAGRKCRPGRDLSTRCLRRRRERMESMSCTLSANSNRTAMDSFRPSTSFLRLARTRRPFLSAVTPDLIRGPELQAPPSPGFPGPRIKSGVTTGDGDWSLSSARSLRNLNRTAVERVGHDEKMS